MARLGLVRADRRASASRRTRRSDATALAGRRGLPRWRWRSSRSPRRCLAYARTRRPSAALAGLGVGGPTAILIGLVAAEAPWPSVPAATLLIGLALALAAALTTVSGWRAVVAIVQAIVYIGAGVAGALGVEWATLAALGAVMVTATVVGAIGRSRAWRVSRLAGCGWRRRGGRRRGGVRGRPSGARRRVRRAGGCRAGALPRRRGASAVAGGRSDATEAAAHAGAVVAVIFTFGWSGRTALVCLLWGIAVGLRALLPGTSRSGRATLAAVAAGFELLAWWLLLTSRGVTLVEAYTVPLALVALLAGWAALRARPELRSWVAYGPALVAGFAPSLAVVLGAEGAPLRRLALGAAALVVVVLGCGRAPQGTGRHRWRRAGAGRPARAGAAVAAGAGLDPARGRRSDPARSGHHVRAPPARSSPPPHRDRPDDLTRGIGDRRHVRGA